MNCILNICRKAASKDYYSIAKILVRVYMLVYMILKIF